MKSTDMGQLGRGGTIVLAFELYMLPRRSLGLWCFEGAGAHASNGRTMALELN